MLPISQAKTLVRQWVRETASHTPGFHGAFFHGSVNDLTETDLLPAASDVDVMLVLDGPLPAQKLGKFLYQGLLIEASYLPLEQLQTAEQVLSNSHLAPSLRRNSLIADPTGRLSILQAQVSRDFARRGWVEKRCEHVQEKVKAHLAALSPDAPFHDQVIPWLFGAGVTTHILLAAGLQNLTVRKRYLAVRELLAEYGRSDFYPSLLDLLGCARMDSAQVASHLDGLEQIFDAAQAFIRSPFPFAADLTPLARPVAIGGTRELIRQGDAREAVFWMAVTASRCMQVLSKDGPPGLLARHDPAYRLLLSDLGIRSPADLQRRCHQTLDLLPSITLLAQEIMAANPMVVP
jgi:hypothetical protein